jgi:carboxyl-terminal processing protease
MFPLPYRRFWLAFALLLSLASLTAPVFSQSDNKAHLQPAVARQDNPYVVPPASEAWETRLLHDYHVTLELPESWRFYAGNSTFFDESWQRGLLLRLPTFELGLPLEDLCEDTASRFSTKYTIDYQPPDSPTRCIIEAPERDVSAALIRLPQANEPPSGRAYDTLGWIAHRDVLPQIVESVSFEPPTTELYLREALRILEENYIFTDEIDWQTVDAQALATLDANSTYDDAHEALATVVLNVLDPLDNGHSAFHLPDQIIADAQGQGIGRGYQAAAIGPTEKRLITLVYPGSPADRAGLRPGDMLLTVNGQTFADFVRDAEAHPDVPVPATLTFEVKRPGEPDEFTVDLTREEFDNQLPVSGRRLDNDIAYIETFSVSDFSLEDSIAYASEAQQTIAALDTPPACGWIVDLRRNTGGELIAMALSAAPLWGEGVFLRARDVSGNVTETSYEDGVVHNALLPQADDTVIAEPYTLSNPDAPVAVLLSNETASMGEVTARALMSRPNAATRTFGERTHGWDITLLNYYTLYDYARIDFSDAVLLDANRDPIRDPIDPDVTMTTDYSVYGTDDDPLIQAASAWLQQQPECGG